MPDPPTLRGTYRTPRVRVGAVVRCEARGCDVVVTGYSTGPIPWPKGRRRGGPRGGPALVVFAGLARAIQSEAAQAVARAWGVTRQTVSTWRKKLGVGPAPDSRKRRAAAARKRVRASGSLPKGQVWSAAEEEAVLTLSPGEAARRTGRSMASVYVRRRILRKRAGGAKGSG